ncbi:MAG: hypothetical protein MUF60_10940, partial [Vicinamibacterales bacterium]|nr:hypothetical protein [Vicinamibacterales bacterium]
MLLDDHRVARELDHFGVRQRVPVALIDRGVDGAHGAPDAAGLATALVVGELHPDEFAAHLAADDRILAGGEDRLVHEELVGVDGALHHGLAEAVGAGDEHHVGEARLGVDGEHDTRGAQVAAHHALHARGQRDVRVLEALVHAIRDRPVVVQRREHVADALEHRLDADHVQVGFLLARERGVGQVLGGGGGPHG